MGKIYEILKLHWLGNPRGPDDMSEWRNSGAHHTSSTFKTAFFVSAPADPRKGKAYTSAALGIASMHHDEPPSAR